MKRLIILGILSFFVLVDCNTGLNISDVDTTYYFGPATETMSWFAAVKKCRSMNMRLLEIRSVAEHFKLLKLMLDNNLKFHTYTWMGGTEDGFPGQYLWISDLSKMEYTNWAAGQPNKGIENCLLVVTDRSSFRWHDHHCDATWPYICYAPKYPDESNDISESRHFY